MTDTNLPVAWRVYDNELHKIVGTFDTKDRALAFCQQLEPVECIYGYRYTMEPVRSTLTSAE